MLSLVKPPDGSPGLRIAAARVLAPQLRGRRGLSAAGDRGGRPQPRLPIRPACAAARALCAPPAGTRRPREHRLAAAALGNDPVVVCNPPRQRNRMRRWSCAALDDLAAMRDAGVWQQQRPQLGLDVFARRPAAVPREGGYVALMGSLPGGAAGQGWVPPTNDSGDDLYANKRVGHRYNTGSVPGLPAMAGVRSKQGAVLHRTFYCDVEHPSGLGGRRSFAPSSAAALLHWEQTEFPVNRATSANHLLRPR